MKNKVDNIVFTGVHDVTLSYDGQDVDSLEKYEDDVYMVNRHDESFSCECNVTLGDVIDKGIIDITTLEEVESYLGNEE